MAINSESWNGGVWMKTRILVALCILAFLISALRFVPSLAMSSSFADFAGGVGVGLAFGLLITWLGTRNRDEG
jgi:hypothetical protein